MSVIQHLNATFVSRLRTQSASRHPVCFGLDCIAADLCSVFHIYFTRNSHVRSRMALSPQHEFPTESPSRTTLCFIYKSAGVGGCLNIKWALWPADNAQRLIAMQSNILCETVNEGLWGISLLGIRYETLSLSLHMKSHWSRTKDRLQIRSTKALLWELQSELMSIDTLSHSVPPEPQLHRGKQSNQTNTTLTESN